MNVNANQCTLNILVEYTFNDKIKFYFCTQKYIAITFLPKMQYCWNEYCLPEPQYF